MLCQCRIKAYSHQTAIMVLGIAAKTDKRHKAAKKRPKEIEHGYTGWIGYHPQITQIVADSENALCITFVNFTFELGELGV